MPEKDTTTPRDELSILQQKVGLFPADMQAPMSEALRYVPAYWNSAAADQTHESIWRSAIRQQLCRYALAHLSSGDLSVSMSEMLESRVRRNLTNLGLAA
jgi:hypothetical protein